ncbi:MAG: Heat shock protein [Actinobacteria bacterium]|jgi:heat shock protein HtpX|nr:Heat shock protein [Actinomycetota bacterium]MEA2500947.1 heat shock protein HtpX [Actinomycetota bacterium]MEA2503564.1 heat shock protein HtpX [Actinomycetota bacterium]
MSTRYPKDPGLTARMTVTIFLLGLLYVVFIGALLAVGVSYGVVIVIAGALLFAQYFFSDKIALFSMHARVVSEQEAPELHAMVDRLCALADMPKPKVGIAESDVPNAFATGRSPKAAVVCVTSGIMRRLDYQELEAVLSHELSHVAHRDVAVMTIASFLGVLAGLITRFTLYAGMFGGGFGGGRGNRDNDSGAMAVLAIMLISIVVYAISFLLTRALSRYRELSADRSGAILIGAPAALASALTKVTGAMSQIPTRDLRSAEAFNAFFFAPALTKGFSLSTLFSTHPPLEKRLEQLARLEEQMRHPA